MEKPRIKTTAVDGEEKDKACVLSSINGYELPDIRTTFDTANDSIFRAGLADVIERAYRIGYCKGEQDSRNKVNELIQWAAKEVPDLL